MPLARLLPIVVFALALSGCSQLESDYGRSKGLTGKRSLNGFGGFRTAFEQAGFDTRDVTRLTQRVKQSDAIVWTPQELESIPTDVTRWFDAWLARGKHTLIYIVPDSGSEVDYWRDASRLAQPSQRLEYRKRAARSTNQRAIWQVNRSPVSTNGWFVVSPSVSSQTSSELSGNWLKDGSSKTGTNDIAQVTTEFKIAAYQEVPPTANPANPANPTTPTVPPAPVIFNGNQPTGPNSAGWTKQATTTATKTKTDFDAKVKNVDGNTIVAIVQSKNWPESQIIVVAGGSLLTNYALTRTSNSLLAARIIDQTKGVVTTDGLTIPKVGFLTTDWQGVSISERKPGAVVASGMELLTVWPISLVTIHGVLLGLVVCLMLFPIFGRPRKIKHVEQNDFGDHLDAVAALMNKAGGEPFARHRISEYFKRIRGESAGPWVLPDTTEHQSFTMHGLHPNQTPTAATQPTPTPQKSDEHRDHQL